MEWIIVIVFLTLGVALFAVELFLIPGFGFVGSAAILLQIIGVYYAFKFGTNAGYLSLVFCTLSDIFCLVFGLRQITSGNLSAKGIIDGKVNNEAIKVKSGDIGITYTILRPNGKAVFGEHRIEVYSLGEFIELNEKIIVVKIEDNKVFVTKI